MIIVMILMCGIRMQVSSSDWVKSLREEVLQFDFCVSLFDTVVSKVLLVCLLNCELLFAYVLYW